MTTIEKPSTAHALADHSTHHIPWRAILWPAKKLAYIPTPKVACTSIKVVLRDAMGIPHEHPSKVHDTQWPHRCDVRNIPVSYKVFCVVRSPWTRLQSCWRSKIANPKGFPGLGDHGGKLYPGMPFDMFVQAVASIPDSQANEHIRSQCSLIQGRANLLLRFENLQDSWWPLWTGYQLPCPPVENNSRDRMVRECGYTAETIKMVAARYAQDASEFGYVWTQH